MFIYLDNQSLIPKHIPPYADFTRKGAINQ